MYVCVCMCVYVCECVCMYVCVCVGVFLMIGSKDGVVPAQWGICYFSHESIVGSSYGKKGQGIYIVRGVDSK